jgi:plastocyanin
MSGANIFDATEETIGAWPFHDHHMHVSEAVDRGLFGALVVRDPHCPPPDIEVPFFLHRLAGAPSRDPLFDSGTLMPGATFSATFNTEAPSSTSAASTGCAAPFALRSGPGYRRGFDKDGPARYDLDDVTVGPGAVVTWTHQGIEPHTVTDAGQAGLESWCINGRTFVGNTPRSAFALADASAGTCSTSTSVLCGTISTCTGRGSEWATR